MTWTAADVPDQSGRVAVVTGANGGIGLETASVLAGAGAHVVMFCRNPSKTEAAQDRIREAHPRASLEVVACDLSSQASVKQAAAELRSRHDRIDLLINNAGVMAIPRRITEDGFEMQLATNHLGHWSLTALVIDLMLRVEGSRVVTVTSELHKAGRIDFGDLNGDRRYSRWRAYAQSKLANVLFARELCRRLLAGRHATISGAAHPGYAATDLQTVGSKMGGHRWTERIIELGNRLVAQTPAMGALPTLYAATSPHMISGMLIGPDGLFDMRGHPEVVVPSKSGQDTELAERLWEVSEELTGVAFDL